MIDFFDAVRKDDRARGELEKLLQYLLDNNAENEAQASTLASTVDILQILNDDTNLAPLLRAGAEAAGGAVIDEDGKVVRRSLIGAAVEVLSRVFARAYTKDGRQACSMEVDPNQVIGVFMRRLLTPMADDKPAPVEVLIDVMADVNRADPSSTSKLESGDYANIASEISDFCLNKGTGLEQVYEVIRQATLP
jgi:hypothetical protein